MPAFEYAALDRRGKTRKGLLEGTTARHVRQQLRDSELLPLQVEPVSPPSRESASQSESVKALSFNGSQSVRSAVSTARGIRVRAPDLALTTRQLATMIEAGLPLAQALSALAQHSEKPRLAKLYLALRARVMEGRSLASALADFPNAFPPIYRATLAAGERSGHLEPVLNRLADFTERRHEVRQKTLLALIYPIVLSVVALLIIVGLMTFVVPEVITVFTSMERELPLLTQGLLAVSELTKQYGLWLFSALAALVLGWRLALRSPVTRSFWHRLLLRLPVAGRLLRTVDSARFARTFSIMLASSVPVLEALRLSAEVVSLLPMRRVIERAAERVKEGLPIAQALAEDRCFPALTVQLIASGEASGRLEKMLEQAARQQEREAETLIATLLGLFEPALILLMGLVVLLIVLAVLLPIFDLNQMIR